MLWGGTWIDDYADPQFGNTFIGLAGDTICSS